MITLEEAKRIVSTAEQKAQQMGQPMNIAVMDAGRNIVAFHRMDGAWVASIDIAIDKAFTSAGRGLTTRKIGEMAQPGQPLFGINTTNGGRIGLTPVEGNLRRRARGLRLSAAPAAPASSHRREPGSRRRPFRTTRRWRIAAAPRSDRARPGGD